MDNLTQTKCQVIFNFYFDSAPFFSSCDTFYSTLLDSTLFYSILLYFALCCSHNTNVLTEKCSLVWQPMSIILPVCGNHTWAKKRSASGFACLHYAWGEPDLTSEPLGEASEIKSGGKWSDRKAPRDETEVGIFCWCGCFNVVSRADRRWKRFGVILKRDCHDLSIKFPLLLKPICSHGFMLLFHILYFPPFMLLFLP